MKTIYICFRLFDFLFVFTGGEPRFLFFLLPFTSTSSSISIEGGEGLREEVIGGEGEEERVADGRGEVVIVVVEAEAEAEEAEAEAVVRGVEVETVAVRGEEAEEAV